VAQRTYKHVDGISNSQAFLEGTFFEYYYGAHCGVKYYVTNRIVLEAAFSAGIQTTHRFNDGQFHEYKPCFYPLLGINYQIF
jgi:hypothetical protein